MEPLRDQLLATRFVLVGLQLALTASVMYASRDFVAKALPQNCSPSGPGCWRRGTSGRSVLAARFGDGAAHGCVVKPESLVPACRRRWESFELVFKMELTLAVCLLIFELFVLLSGVHSPHNEVMNFFSSLFHLGGCSVIALYLVSGASCTTFHAVFLISNFPPFACEMVAMVSCFQGARPLKRFVPPESAAERME
eukprot:TRINITY_DN69764_c0_g1_i1.p1 TRINITY_DN69764_c0_g1~~TRINITY_DN69764_c0_g1_i1.p1  ORF type:complete len:196 (-),score=14.68 TRINITY_DN69764_c0_g1_i1:109-696(-)